MIELELPDLDLAGLYVGLDEITNPFTDELRLDLKDIPLSILEQHCIGLQQHIYAVWHFSKYCMPSTPYNHDKSKWSEDELPAYVKYFSMGKKEKDKLGFSLAWHHHVIHNPHHWEHWVLPGGYSFGHAVNGCLPMPEYFRREMICDWLSASFCYTGSVDMTKWLAEKSRDILLHPKTRKYIIAILHYDLGYSHDVLLFPEV